MVDFWAVPCRIFRLCLALILIKFVITKSHWNISVTSWPTVTVEPWRWIDSWILVWQWH